MLDLLVADPRDRSKAFEWDARGVEKYLPVGWKNALIEYTKRNMALHYIHPGDETSREEDRSVSIPTFVVSGEQIFRDLPWLVEFYQGPALRMMREFYRDEDLRCATNPLYAINLQAAYDVDPSGQVMRYECHVDWAPTGLLYVTSHPAGSGGELVVANRPGDVGRDLLDNCVRIGLSPAISSRFE